MLTAHASCHYPKRHLNPELLCASATKVEAIGVASVDIVVVGVVVIIGVVVGIVVIVVGAPSAHALTPLAAVAIATPNGQQTAAVVGELLQSIGASAEGHTVGSVRETAAVTLSY